MSGNFDLFDLPEQGSARSVGSKFGNIAGVSTDVVWPESKLIKDEIEPGRLQTFKFRADKHRWWHPRSTRLSVKYEFKFGEVEGTAKDPNEDDGAGTHWMGVAIEPGHPDLLFDSFGRRPNGTWQPWLQHFEITEEDEAMQCRQNHRICTFRAPACR